MARVSGGSRSIWIKIQFPIFCAVTPKYFFPFKMPLSPPKLLENVAKPRANFSIFLCFAYFSLPKNHF